MSSRIKHTTNFYSQVMSTRVRPKAKKNAKAIKAKPKAKGGGSAKSKGFAKGVGGGDPLLKVILSADAGADSSHTQDDFYEHHLKKLTKKQLSSLMKKIEKMRLSYLEGSEEREAIEELEKLATDSIDKYLEHSEEKILDLKTRIQSRLNNFLPVGYHKNERGVIYITLRKRCVRIDTFIKRQFLDLILLYNQLIMNGEIIVDSHKTRGLGFIRQTIRDYLEPQR